jgi:4-hydroxy-3-methylbut-2-enyl diphosphate reductase
MLKGETQEIGKMLERTMMEKYGPAELNNHFLLMDTICDATQVCRDLGMLLMADQWLHCTVQ